MKALPTSPGLRRYLRHGTFPQLVTLEAVMRLGSAIEAAETLCMAPSTLSGHLHRLGESLDVTLFETHGRQLVPTPAAVALLETSREIFAAIERCEQRLGSCRAAPPMAPARGDCRHAVAEAHATAAAAVDGPRRARRPTAQTGAHSGRTPIGRRAVQAESRAGRTPR